jgi:hypothetical protein
VNRQEYREWFDWADILVSVEGALPEPTRTLVRHVMALQERIDQLMHPDDHDQSHGSDCRCTFVQCACAYEHPDSVCMVHAGYCPQCGGVGGNHNAVLLSDKS